MENSLGDLYRCLHLVAHASSANWLMGFCPNPHSELNMKLAALVSGGKDSCFAICESIVHGHEIVALVNLKPCDTEASQVEIDSYMFQSVATEGIRYFADALEVPLFQANITGTAVCQSLSYHQSPADEVEDLFNLLDSVKKQIPDLEGVTSGAILSDYQRERVEQVCQRLRLHSFAFLWRRSQRELLMEMISSKLHAVIVKAKDPKEIKTSVEELLAMETEIDVGTGAQLRRPFRSIRQRLLALATEVPQELAEKLASSSCPLITAALPTTSHKSLPGTRPLGGFLCMTRTFTGVVALPSSGDVRESITEATQNALDRMQRHLGADGFDMDRVVHVHVVVSANVDLSSQDSFSALNQPFEAAFDTPDHLRKRAGNVPPSRVCVATQWPQKLIHLLRINEQYSDRAEEEKVEAAEQENLVIVGVSAVVLLPNTETADVAVTGMRVRSFSHWAPAVIGPYSQAVRVRVTHMEEDDDSSDYPCTLCSAFYAGQIGLIPETGRLPEMCDVNLQTDDDGQATYAHQGWLSLRHVHRVLEVMDPNSWHHLRYAIAYATSLPALETARTQFHCAVCKHLTRCLCDSHVVWAVVSGLPKGAALEWQITSSDSPPPRAVFPDPHLPSAAPAVAASSLDLLLVSTATPRLDKASRQFLSANPCAATFPVLRFMDPALTLIGVKC